MCRAGELSIRQLLAVKKILCQEFGNLVLSPKYFNLYTTVHVLYMYILHTAKTQYRKYETKYPRKGIAWPQSQFPHLCVCERFIYSHHGLPILLQENMWTDPGYI
jgi:hypothetical protein